jgi:hypothetical protein
MPSSWKEKIEASTASQELSIDRKKKRIEDRYKQLIYWHVKVSSTNYSKKIKPISKSNRL